jgi:hypothetical protein
MSIRNAVMSIGFVVAFTAGFAVRDIVNPVPVVQALAAPAAAAQGNRVFEVRTYIASAGKFEALKARFRDHTLKFFDKHNMRGVGYWTPIAGTPGAGNTITYILAHPSREAATKSWEAFNSDQEWLKVRAESIKDGNPVARVDSYFLEPLDFSPIK